MFPRISIVTPSYNQGMFLEDTIKSVLDQGYPNLQYIIVDGGSKDDSAAIIRKYEKQLDYWVSEPDSGQSEAINKGLRRCDGEIISWLCSDDMYEPGALHKAAELFQLHPDAGLIHGDTILLHPDGRNQLRRTELPDLEFRYFSCMPFSQPSSFFRKNAPGVDYQLDEKLHFAMDYDLLIQIALHHKIEVTDFVFSKYRLHKESKTVSQLKEFVIEWQRVFCRFLRSFDDIQDFIAALQKAGLYSDDGKKYSTNRKFVRSDLLLIVCYFLQTQAHLYYQLLDKKMTEQITVVMANLDPEFYKERNLGTIRMRARYLPSGLIQFMRYLTR